MEQLQALKTLMFIGFWLATPLLGFGIGKFSNNDMLDITSFSYEEFASIREAGFKAGYQEATYTLSMWGYNWCSIVDPETSKVVMFDTCSFFTPYNEVMLDE